MDLREFENSLVYKGSSRTACVLQALCNTLCVAVLYDCYIEKTCLEMKNQKPNQSKTKPHQNKQTTPRDFGFDLQFEGIQCTVHHAS